ncbi:hypothetical protein BC828DRAFT_48274 [Blastocladiella britannica]|nr:hypothetical protein BC828DRAFT_48274 [Blastocladiella britannica]
MDPHQKTLEQLSDRKVIGAQIVGLLVSVLATFSSVRRAIQRPSPFYLTTLLTAVPLLFADVWYFLTIYEITSTVCASWFLGMGVRKLINATLMPKNSELIIRALATMLSCATMAGVTIARLRGTGSLERNLYNNNAETIALVFVTPNTLPWLTRRMFLVIIVAIVIEVVGTTGVLGASYVLQLKGQPYLTSHPWRTPAVMVQLATSSFSDLVASWMTFRVVWTIRARVLKGGISSFESTGAMGSNAGRHSQHQQQQAHNGNPLHSVDVLTASSAALMAGSAAHLPDGSGTAMGKSQLMIDTKHHLPVSLPHPQLRSQPQTQNQSPREVESTRASSHDQGFFRDLKTLWSHTTGGEPNNLQRKAAQKRRRFLATSAGVMVVQMLMIVLTMSALVIFSLTAGNMLGSLPFHYISQFSGPLTE